MSESFRNERIYITFPIFFKAINIYVWRISWKILKDNTIGKIKLNFLSHYFQFFIFLEVVSQSNWDGILSQKR